MYRHATHTLCASCNQSLAFDAAELDDQARFVCVRCGARARFDAALARWKRPHRDLDTRDLPLIFLVTIAGSLFLLFLG
jgi:hypothetical protein